MRLILDMLSSFIKPDFFARQVHSFQGMQAKCLIWGILGNPGAQWI